MRPASVSYGTAEHSGTPAPVVSIRAMQELQGTDAQTITKYRITTHMDEPSDCGDSNTRTRHHRMSTALYVLACAMETP